MIRNSMLTKDEWFSAFKRYLSKVPKDLQIQAVDRYDRIFNEKISSGMSEKDIIASFPFPEVAALPYINGEISRSELKYNPVVADNAKGLPRKKVRIKPLPIIFSIIFCVLFLSGVIVGTILVLKSAYTIKDFTYAFLAHDFETSDKHNSLLLDLKVGNIKISRGNRMIVKLPKELKYEIQNVGNGYIISSADNHSIIEFAEYPDIEVTVPVEMNILYIQLGAGSVDIQQGSFNTLGIMVLSGDINLGSVYADNMSLITGAGKVNLNETSFTVADIKVFAGNVKGIIYGVKWDYKITTGVSVGSSNLLPSYPIDTGNGLDESVTRTFDVKVAFGNIDLSFSG